MNRISHIEIRFRDGKYYVLIVKEVGEKRSKVGFVSANETQARRFRGHHRRRRAVSSRADGQHCELHQAQAR